MAGTLTISTLSDGTNSTSSTNCIQGSAKAWVYFNSAGTVQASYNVSSVTNTATGSYQVNFTNAFADAKYAMSGTTQAGYTLYDNSRSTTNIVVSTYYGATSSNYACSVVIHR